MNDVTWVLLHFGASAFMAGVIWFVQVVHYPLMRFVTEGWSKFEIAHQNRTTIVVAPVMFVEALATVMVWLESPSDAMRIASIITLAAVLISTFAVQVPIHAALSRGFDAKRHRLLVWTNLMRAILWSWRVVIGFVILRAS